MPCLLIHAIALIIGCASQLRDRRTRTQTDTHAEIDRRAHRLTHTETDRHTRAETQNRDSDRQIDRQQSICCNQCSLHDLSVTGSEILSTLLSTECKRYRLQTSFNVFTNTKQRQAQYESSQAREKRKLKAKGKDQSQSEKQHQGKS